MTFTVTDDPEKPLFIGTTSIVIGCVEVLPPDDPFRRAAREAIYNFNREASRRNRQSIARKIRARFTE